MLYTIHTRLAPFFSFEIPLLGNLKRTCLDEQSPWIEFEYLSECCIMCGTPSFCTSDSFEDSCQLRILANNTLVPVWLFRGLG